jgi:hypothetical protein
MKYLNFEKNSNNEWYVILPEWKGDKSELQMVCGADIMLDILSQGEKQIELCIDTISFDNYTMELEFEKEHLENYLLFQKDYKVNEITPEVLSEIAEELAIKSLLDFNKEELEEGLSITTEIL